MLTRAALVSAFCAPLRGWLHVVAGLLDLNQHLGNKQAMAVLKKMATFIGNRIERLIKAKGDAWWVFCLNAEFGGMNELAYNLYAITRDPSHLQLASAKSIYWFSPRICSRTLVGYSDPSRGRGGRSTPSVFCRGGQSAPF